MRRDRDVKLPLYALASVPEVWIVDVQAQHVVVHRHPQGDRYEHVATVGRDGQLSVDALPGLQLTVSEILGL